MSAPSLCSALAMADSSLLDDAGGLLLGEGQDVERLDRPSCRGSGPPPGGPCRRQANATNDCFGFHRRHPYFFLAFLSAGVPLKVRVSANSPSLWPTIWSVTTHRHVLLAVVHGDRQTDELGQDRRAARPGLDRLLVLVGGGLVDLGCQVVVHERTLLRNEPCPSSLLISCDARR